MGANTRNEASSLLSGIASTRGALIPVRLVRMFGSLTAQLFNDGLRTGAGEKLAGFIGDVRFAAKLLYLLALFFRHGIVVSVQSHRALLFRRTTQRQQERSALVGASAPAPVLREMAFHR